VPLSYRDIKKSERQGHSGRYAFDRFGMVTAEERSVSVATSWRTAAVAGAARGHPPPAPPSRVDRANWQPAFIASALKSWNSSAYRNKQGTIVQVTVSEENVKYGSRQIHPRV